MNGPRAAGPILAILMASAACGPAAAAPPADSAPPSGSSHSEDAAANPPVALREGYLVNFVHRYYAPLDGNWTLSAGADGDYQSLLHASLPGVVAQILVAGEGKGDLNETIAALREKAGEEPRTRVLAESAKRMGVRDGRELLTLREPAAVGQPVVLVRTIAFLRSPSKYYLRLEAPAASYEKANADFEKLVAGLKFEFRLFSTSSP